MILLDLNLGSSFLELGLEGFGLVLGDALLEGGGCAVNDALGLLQALTGQLFHELHDRELGATGSLENDVKLRLLFATAAFAAASGGASDNSSSSCGLDAVLIFEDICEFADLFDGEVDQRLCHGFRKVI